MLCVMNVVSLPGSSVDLTPSLMTIYDTFSTSHNRTVTFANQDECIPPPSEPSRPPPANSVQDQPPADQGLSKSCSNVSFTVVDENENVERDSRRESSVQSSPRRESDSPWQTVCVTPKHYLSRMDNSCTGGGMNSNLTVDPGGSPQCNNHANGSGCHGERMDMDNDARKRPLSISSTSSSTSSTSSLPRHQRKKMASCATTTMVVPMSTESDEVDEAEYIQCIRRVAQEHARFLPDIPSDHSLHEEDYEPVSSPLSYRRVLDSPAVHLNSSNSLNGSIATSPGLSYSHSSQTSGAGNFSPYSNHAQARFLFDVQGTSYIDKVVAEIIETERAYVSDLQDIIQVSLIFQITFQLYLTI